MVASRLHSFTELLPDAAVFIDGDQRITHVNAQLCDLLGWQREDLLGEPLVTLIPERHRAGHRDHVDAFRVLPKRHQPMSNRPVILALARDGTEKRVSVSIAKLDWEGEIVLVGFLRELPLELTDAQLHAETDTLTEAASRLRLSREMQRRRQYDQPCGLLYLDLNHFKPINDEHGHAVGDEVLRVVARRLARCVREVDLVARVGGDEFVVLLHDFDDPERLESIAGKLHAAVGQPIYVKGRMLRVGTAIGGVIAAHPLDEAALLERADRAMFEAKRCGLPFALDGAVTA
ncbi:MAG: sensor domain-containing diguanylate cyclase [Pseudomonadales bacterium]|jgi:diguanylate cyclase (GGDEF)-like protein/PAS domain S-box-containing protein|nr:sensor domain-containing diguanylate cyclase [Pseudomonadales bacterium]